MVKSGADRQAVVTVVGGGIAGCAACLALAERGVPAAWIASGTVASDKPGESLAAAAVALLAKLGVDALLADPAHRQAQVSFTSWGSGALLERHAAAQPGGLGHVLDRGRFEAGLHAAVRRRPGVQVIDGELQDFERSAAGWALDIGTGERIGTRVLIDATGRRARIGRQLSAQHRLDRLIAAYGVLRPVADDVDPTPATLVEAVEEGWWYASLLADRRLVLNFYSDPDLMPRRIGSDGLVWRQSVERTRYISRWIDTAGYALSEPAQLATAGTAWLDNAAGEDWLAVGDAAASFDPLSAHGMTTALWTGMRAGEAAARVIAGDVSAPANYAAQVHAGREHFRREREAIYSRETRFRDHEFWRRRQGALHRLASGY